jgi:hypothetical protein
MCPRKCHGNTFGRLRNEFNLDANEGMTMLRGGGPTTPRSNPDDKNWTLQDTSGA